MLLKRIQILFTVICIICETSLAQQYNNGLNMSMGNLYMLSDAKTRSISPENFTGEKGKGGMAKIEDKDIPNSANAANAAL